MIGENNPEQEEFLSRYTKAYFLLLCTWSIVLLLIATPPFLFAKEIGGNPFEQEITYPADWGPNILDPKVGSKIIEVSSNGLDFDGTKTLNDGLAIEGHHWEPVWGKTPYYFIVKLKRTASVERIQFTTQSNGRGYPKRVTVIPLASKDKPLAKGRILQLENNPVQFAELTPPLPEAQYLRFEFDENTYEKNELEIGEVALFEVLFVSHSIAPGSKIEDRIRFMGAGGDEIFGKIEFPRDMITIEGENGRLDIQFDKIYGIRSNYDSVDPKKVQILLWSGEIVTGKIQKMNDLLVRIGREKWPLYRYKITEVALAKTDDRSKLSKQYMKKVRKNKLGVLDFVSGDRFYVDPDSLIINLESATAKEFAETVPLKDLIRIDTARGGETGHRIIYKNNEIIYASLKTAPLLDIKLLADVNLNAQQRDILTYQALSGRNSTPDEPFDVLALTRGDLIIGLLENSKLKLRSPHLGEISVDADMILTVRSKRDRQGQVEILLTNGSKLQGKMISKFITFRRSNQSRSVSLNIKDLGVLERFSKEKLAKLEDALEEGLITRETTDVALYLFTNKKNFNTVSKMLETVLKQSKARGLWTFKAPEWKRPVE